MSIAEQLLTLKDKVLALKDRVYDHPGEFTAPALAGEALVKGDTVIGTAYEPAYLMHQTTMPPSATYAAASGTLAVFGGSTAGSFLAYDIIEADQLAHGDTLDVSEVNADAVNCGVVFSPDGKWMVAVPAYAAGTADTATVRIYKVTSIGISRHLDTGHACGNLFSAKTFLRASDMVAWSPDSSQLFFVFGTGSTIRSVASYHVVGDTFTEVDFPVNGGGDLDTYSTITHLAVTPDGGTLFVGYQPYSYTAGTTFTGAIAFTVIAGYGERLGAWQSADALAALYAMRVSADGNWLALAQAGTTTIQCVRLYHRADGVWAPVVLATNASALTAYDLLWMPGGAHLYVLTSASPYYLMVKIVDSVPGLLPGCVTGTLSAAPMGSTRNMFATLDGTYTFWVSGYGSCTAMAPTGTDTWALMTTSLLGSLYNSGSPATFMPSARLVISGSSTRYLYRIPETANTALESLAGWLPISITSARSAAFTPDGSHAVVGSGHSFTPLVYRTLADGRYRRIPFVCPPSHNSSLGWCWAGLVGGGDYLLVGQFADASNGSNSYPAIVYRCDWENETFVLVAGLTIQTNSIPVVICDPLGDMFYLAPQYDKAFYRINRATDTIAKIPSAELGLVDNAGSVVCTDPFFAPDGAAVYVGGSYETLKKYLIERDAGAVTFVLDTAEIPPTPDGGFPVYLAMTHDGQYLAVRKYQNSTYVYIYKRSGVGWMEIARVSNASGGRGRAIGDAFVLPTTGGPIVIAIDRTRDTVAAMPVYALTTAPGLDAYSDLAINPRNYHVLMGGRGYTMPFLESFVYWNMKCKKTGGSVKMPTTTDYRSLFGYVKRDIAAGAVDPAGLAILATY